MSPSGSGLLTVHIQNLYLKDVSEDHAKDLSTCTVGPMDLNLAGKRVLLNVF